MNTSITYVAMDTHKKRHTVAALFPEDGEIVEMTVANNRKEISRMVKKILRRSTNPVRFCYEAGVCGFALQRLIESFDCKCSVIAPSLIPRKPGERIKTDRRDAKKLLALFEAGLLTEVFPPDEEQETARELTRLCESAMINLKRIRHQLQKFLTRNGFIYSEGRCWTQRHLNWLSNLDPGNPALSEIFNSYMFEMNHCLQRLQTLDKEVERLAQSGSYREPVNLLRCFLGIETLTAISIITEIFDFGRFRTAKELMSYLGLTPSESSSGEKQSKGSICKTGNRRVRRLLNETAWHFRHSNIVGKALRNRRKGQPDWAIHIAEKAEQRLRRRYYRLVNNGKMPCKAVIAVARELSGFIWAMLNEYEIRKAI